jgi:hypothetical protein
MIVLRNRHLAQWLSTRATQLVNEVLGVLLLYCFWGLAWDISCKERLTFADARCLMTQFISMVGEIALERRL